MDDLSAFPSGFKELVSTLEAFAYPLSSAPLRLSTTFSLVPKYLKDDLQQMLKVVLGTRTPATAASLLETS